MAGRSGAGRPSAGRPAQVGGQSGYGGLPNTLEAEIFRRQCRQHYSAYVQYANPRFYMTRFHQYLCDKIQTFLDAPCSRALDILLLSIPPRSGKSYTVTETLPSWLLGRDPSSHVIIAGYESDFAEQFNRKNRDKFVQYATQIFPDAAINPNAQGMAMWETTEGGVCRAAGLKAGITGYGAEVFIIDDPIKNKEQADSAAVLAKIQDEMGPSVQSRIHPGGKLIVIQTRWVEGDVIGWIQDHWADYIFETINLPAEYDEEAQKLGPCPLGRRLGDSLMGAHLGDDESKMPQVILNNNSMLQSKKKLVIASDGARTWNALYQGRPSAQDGNLFSPGVWSRFTRSDALLAKSEYCQLSIDATFKNTETSDFVAMEMWVLVGRSSYLWKLVNKRMDFVQTLHYIHKLCDQYAEVIDELVIEDKANGSAIITTLQYENNLPPIVAVNPKGGKLARAQAVAPYVVAHNCYLPDDLTSDEDDEIEWDNHEAIAGVQKFVRQHATFPFGRKDDMVDACTQALSRTVRVITGEVTPPPRTYTRYIHWRPDQWEDYEQMDELAQSLYVRRYGAPEEWAPDSYWEDIKNIV